MTEIEQEDWALVKSNRSTVLLINNLHIIKKKIKSYKQNNNYKEIEKILKDMIVHHGFRSSSEQKKKKQKNLRKAHPAASPFLKKVK